MKCTWCRGLFDHVPLAGELLGVILPDATGTPASPPSGTRSQRLGPHVHFIGHLQSNKVRLIAPLVGVWETVDRAVDRDRPAVLGGAWV